MEPAKAKHEHEAVKLDLIPELVPAPLFSPRASHDLPHLVDMNVDEPSVAERQHDDLFWNSTLEGKGNEAAPEHDVLGRVNETRRAYWVKGLPHDGSTMREDVAHTDTDIPQHGGPVSRDFAFDRSSSVSSSPASQLSNYDLYAPPTPPWPKRSDSLKGTHFEPVIVQGSSTSESRDLFVGQDEHRYDPNIMRGGGQPGSFKFNLPPYVVGNITAFAEADPLKDHGQRRPYKAVPTVGVKIHEQPVVHPNPTQVTTPNHSFPLWEYDPPRPSTTELENAYLPPSSAPEPSKVASVRTPSKTTPTSTTPTSEHAFQHSSTARPPDIEDHPAFRNGQNPKYIISSNGIRKGEHAEPREQSPIGSRNVKSPRPPVNGIPVNVVEEPPTHHYPSSRETNGKCHSPPSLHRVNSFPSKSSYTPPKYAHSPALAPDDEIENYMLHHPPRDQNPYTTLYHYERILANQAKSIRHLQRLIDDLTQRRDYYEQDLLPRTLTHWSDTSRENHTLTAALRQNEEESAMLWDLLSFSRKLLDLCWQRDNAVLQTARTMRLRKINRANCGLLERLVDSFGPGRGGGERKDRRKRAESPYREDLEQLVFVCEQNLRLLGEDLEDWNGSLGVIQGVRGERDKVDGEGEGIKQEGVRDV